jgi:hypothetical protein
MMFTCCHPRLPEAAQIALILHVLCGFSVGEVAAALMSSRDAVEKRLSRGKQVLAGSKRLFDVAMTGEFNARVPAVRRLVLSNSPRLPATLPIAGGRGNEHQLARVDNLWKESGRRSPRRSRTAA